MNKILFFLACSLQVGLVEAQKSDQTPYLLNTFSRDQVRQVSDTTSGGNITVTGQASGEARVEVYIQSNNGRNGSISKEEIQKRLDEQFDPDVSVSNGTLKASATTKKEHRNEWNNNSLSISFRIYVPQNAGTSLRTSGGNI